MESRDGRGAIESALQRLRRDLPALPQLRDFQVAEASLIYDSSCSHCLIVDGHLRSPMNTFWQLSQRALGKPCQCFYWDTSCLQVLKIQSLNPNKLQEGFTGFITMILVPLITIEQQLLSDCKSLGLTAIAGSQVNS